MELQFDVITVCIHSKFKVNMVINESVQNIPIEQLRVHKNNPRQGDVGAIVQSIKQNGFYGYLVVQKSTGVIIAGNHRYLAAKHCGLKEVPCVLVDVSDDRALRILLADNRTNDLASYNNEALAELLVDMQRNTELALEGTAFDADALDEILKSLEPAGMDVKEDGLVEGVETIETDIQIGDLYKLGEHRLICGDSTNRIHVEKLLNGITPILMVTDPPYGVKYDPMWRKKAGVTNSKRMGSVENDDRCDWTEAYNLFKGEVVYVWHGGKNAAMFADNLISAGFEIVSQIIWNKQQMVLSRGDYHWKHEPCWYAVRSGKNHNWCGDRSQTTIWDIKNLVSSKEEDSKQFHGTQKPIECMAIPIRNNSNTGDSVYDPFLGSGTTLIAAEQLKRICYGVELSPQYCQAIIWRWEKLTGNKSEKSLNRKDDYEP